MPGPSSVPLLLLVDVLCPPLLSFICPFTLFGPVLCLVAPAHWECVFCLAGLGRAGFVLVCSLDLGWFGVFACLVVCLSVLLPRLLCMVRVFGSVALFVLACVCYGLFVLCIVCCGRFV